MDLCYNIVTEDFYSHIINIPIIENFIAKLNASWKIAEIDINKILLNEKHYCKIYLWFNFYCNVIKILKKVYHECIHAFHHMVSECNLQSSYEALFAIFVNLQLLLVSISEFLHPYSVYELLLKIIASVDHYFVDFFEFFHPHSLYELLLKIRAFCC